MQVPFVFANAAADIGLLTSHVATVGPGLSGKNELLDVLVEQLECPEYFGDNWDALDECLRDLSWLEEHRVLVFHETLPELPGEDLMTYIEILRDAVLDWREDDDNELVVAFPPAARDAVEALLTQADS